MNFQTVEKDGVMLVELACGNGIVKSERDALDLVAACGERGINLLLLSAACLSEEFFRLRTGLAGAVLQKLVNYGVKTAVVAPPGAASQGKFRDFMLETNRGSQFRIFEGREKAINWLIG